MANRSSTHELWSCCSATGTCCRPPWGKVTETTTMMESRASSNADDKWQTHPLADGGPHHSQVDAITSSIFGWYLFVRLRRSFRYGCKYHLPMNVGSGLMDGRFLDGGSFEPWMTATGLRMILLPDHDLAQSCDFILLFGQNSSIWLDSVNILVGC